MLTKAQLADTVSADGLLQAARKAAFDRKDYTLAKHYLYKALGQSPDYADIKIFLGRIHTWTGSTDSARFYFSLALKNNPGYADASVAYSDLEYWNDRYESALAIVDSGLVHHPADQDLLLRRAKILNAMRRYVEANTSVQQLLSVNKHNSDALLLANRIRELASRNKIGLSYDYVYFDKQFADPWHLASFDYTRTTRIGSVTGRINYANRFKENGVQYELEAYPHISNTFYAYINGGYSENVGVFPKWRGGFSLYANLPAGFECDLGVRYLQFSSSPTWIYTGSLGKYYKSWLFNFRSYVTPSSFASSVSASYNLSTRYYFGGADDFLGMNIGYGLSPDDRQNSIQLENPVKLTTYKAGASLRKKIAGFNVLSVDASWFNQEYLPGTKGNQYQFSLGWIFRF
ncbi:YaiO family outer membrane beta-barrel protein [Sediminibacterium sp. WSJ-3]|nr:YaiO family outer membrane beta-barrel protein [Sediminibacterium soli]